MTARMQTVVAPAAVGAGLGALVAFHETVGRPALLIALAIVVPLPILVRIAQRRWDPLEPIALASAGFLIMFLMRPLAHLAYDERQLIPGSQYDIMAGFDEALLIGLVGIVVFYLGYASPVGRALAFRARPLPSRWPADTAATVAIGLVVLGLLLWTVFLVQSGGIGRVFTYVQGRSSTDPQLFRESSGYFYLGPYLTIPAALLLLATNARHRSLFLLVSGVTAVAFVVVITGPRGDRGFLLLLFVALAAHHYLRKGKRPSGVMIFGTLFATLVLVNFLLEYRRVETRDRSAVGALAETIVHPGAQLRTFLLGADTAMMPLMAILVEDVDGHVPFDTIESLVAVPVPGPLWPDKPIPPDFTFYQKAFPSNAQATDSGNSLSVIGGFYYDGWWFGVVGYGLLAGAGWRALFEYLRRFPRSSGVQLFYASMLPFILVMLRDGPVYMFARMTFVVFPLLGCLWLLTWRFDARVGSRVVAERR